MVLLSLARNEAEKLRSPVFTDQTAHGRCLTRTGDLLLVRQALYQLS